MNISNENNDKVKKKIPGSGKIEFINVKKYGQWHQSEKRIE